MKSSPLVRLFTGDKLVESQLLNLMGAQVARTLIARALYNIRSTPAEVDASVKEKVEELRENGMVLFHNFLPADFFTALREECLRLLDEEDPGKFIVRNHGPNTYEVAKLKNFNESQYPTLFTYVRNPILAGIMSAAEKQPMVLFAEGNLAVERLTQGPYGENEDPETDLHSDIFYNTHKSWLYLDDVTLAHGPLVYVKGSPNLRLKQLQYVYGHSTNQNRTNDSRRISQEELKELGLEETVVTCPKNTLVIANTCGYHRRLRGEPGKIRRSIHVSLRTDPFRWWKHWN